MNPVHKFYRNLLDFVREHENTENGRRKILACAQKTFGLSWNIDDSEISNLHFVCSNPQKHEIGMFSEAQLYSVKKFIIAAFHDLSVIKNPHAMCLFMEFNKITQYSGFLTMFAKTIVPRYGGSGIIVLHVSDTEKFSSFIRRHDNSGAGSRNLLNGAIINT